MANLRPVPPPRGDEAQLFREYNDELMLTVAQNVRTDSPQTVEDAVGFAWERFMVYQPERDMKLAGLAVPHRPASGLADRATASRSCRDPRQSSRLGVVTSARDDG